MITKTLYPTFGKIVLSDERTGIMISQDYYTELSATGNSDESIFEGMKVD